MRIRVHPSLSRQREKAQIVGTLSAVEGLSLRGVFAFSHSLDKNTLFPDEYELVYLIVYYF